MNLIVLPAFAHNGLRLLHDHFGLVLTGILVTHPFGDHLRQRGDALAARRT